MYILRGMTKYTIKKHVVLLLSFALLQHQPVPYIVRVDVFHQMETEPLLQFLRGPSLFPMFDLAVH